MDHHPPAFPATALSRRQFGLLFGGGAVLLVAGGTYGVIARTESSGPALGFATPFGTVTVLRAGRFARLDAYDRTAASNLAMAVSHFKGQGRAHAQRPVIEDAGSAPVFGSHDHHDGADPSGGGQPVNLTWGDVVVLELELLNRTAAPVLFSPGQLRLRFSQSDMTVTPQDSDRGSGALAAYTGERVLISYLAPQTWARFELEFTDDPHLQHHRLPLPPLAMTEVLS